MRLVDVTRLVHSRHHTKRIRQTIVVLDPNHSISRWQLVALAVNPCASISVPSTLNRSGTTRGAARACIREYNARITNNI